MTVTLFVLTCLGALLGIGTFYYLARQNSLSARERAIADAKAPLQREINDLRSDIADLRIENRDLRRRCEHLEDELRQHR